MSSVTAATATTTSKFVVCALYHFVRLSNLPVLQTQLKQLMDANTIRGTLLLAEEGINGTVAGSRSGISTMQTWLRNDERFKDLVWKESIDTEMPFAKAKVKLKKEIVTMGIPSVDPNDIKGTYVEPKDWNALISDPNVTLIDTRNDYEVRFGTFQNAINPKTDTFKQFPEFLKSTLGEPNTEKKVAMFCTGGIRCEKSTAYLKTQGFDKVYHLQGGILKYLEEIPEEKSMWEGECFVFDDRVTVNHKLERGNYEQCHACHSPISREDMKSPQYVVSESCPYCFGKTDPERQKRLAEKRRHAQHIKDLAAQGETLADEHAKNKAVKLKRREVAEQKRKEAQAAAAVAASAPSSSASFAGDASVIEEEAKTASSASSQQPTKKFKADNTTMA